MIIIKLYFYMSTLCNDSVVVTLSELCVEGWVVDIRDLPIGSRAIISARPKVSPLLRRHPRVSAPLEPSH